MQPMTARLTTGSAAPAFTLPDQDGQSVSLADYAGGTVILYFYPAAMTPGCTTQAVDFSESLADFTEGGYTVLLPSSYSARGFCDKHTDAARMPVGGRAPGWDAGLVVARRQDGRGAGPSAGQ